LGQFARLRRQNAKRAQTSIQMGARFGHFRWV
jgi:hypothetical protein